MWLRRLSGDINRLLKKRRCPWFDKLTMRINSLKTLDLILRVSKDEAKLSGFFGSLLRPARRVRLRALWARRALLLFWG
jgi:hypothetical protein